MATPPPPLIIFFDSCATMGWRRLEKTIMSLPAPPPIIRFEFPALDAHACAHAHTHTHTHTHTHIHARAHMLTNAILWGTTLWGTCFLPHRGSFSNPQSILQLHAVPHKIAFTHSRTHTQLTYFDSCYKSFIRALYIIFILHSTVLSFYPHSTTTLTCTHTNTHTHIHCYTHKHTYIVQ